MLVRYIKRSIKIYDAYCVQNQIINAAPYTILYCIQNAWLNVEDSQKIFGGAPNVEKIRFYDDKIDFYCIDTNWDICVEIMTGEKC